MFVSKVPLSVLFSKKFVNILSITVTQREVSLLGFVIVGCKPMLNIDFINSSVVL